MNDPRFGEAIATTMDRLDKLEQRGDLEGFELQEVLVLVGYTKLSNPEDEIEPDAIESLIFVDGTTQVPYVQVGLLYLALNTATSPEG
jgi:hypothetical protein